MSFEEEWAQQKGEVIERHSSQMRLNQLPADQGATTQPPLLGSRIPARTTAAVWTEPLA